MKSKLILNEISLQVHLGCSEQERLNTQPVKVKVALTFQSPPKAISSDRLEDTFCYEDLTKKLKRFCDEKNFHLVEHLAHGLFKMIKENIPSHVSLELQLIKVHPPVDEITGGVSFILGDS